MILVGLKSDQGNFRQISYATADAVATAVGATYLEVSAFTRTNLRTLVDAMVAITLSKYMDTIMHLECKQNIIERKRPRSCSIM